MKGRYFAASALALTLAAGMDAAEPDRRIVEAARAGNRAEIASLLKARVPVNTQDADGTTALHWAVRANDKELADRLMGAGASVKIADRYGITPLVLACENGSAALVEPLLRAGADANTVLPNGETALMIASRTGKPDVIRMLLARGANPNARESRFGETAVMWAAAEDNGDAVRALADGGADLNARSDLMKFPEFKFITSGMVTTSLPKGGWTPLMYAARQGAVSSARALAERGADANLTDPDGTTALVIAVINAHFDLAAMLLDRGADPNVADVTGMAALYAAVDMHTLGPMLSRPGPKVTDELDAADLVKVLLTHGADPNVRLKRPILGRHHDSGDASLGEGTTPLMRAAKTVDVPVMRILLEQGANAALTQKDYSTALMIVMSGGRGGAATEAATIEAARLCLEHGVDIDAFNAAGQTAVHLAAQRGADAVVRFLAESGAKLDMKNKQGRTPLDLALGGAGGPRGAAAAPRESTAAVLRQFLR